MTSSSDTPLKLTFVASPRPAAQEACEKLTARYGQADLSEADLTGALLALADRFDPETEECEPIDPADEGVGGSLSGDPGTGGSELTTPIGLLDPHDTVLDGSQTAIPTRGNREGHQTLLETITVQFAGDRGCMVRVTSGVGEGLRLGVLHLADPPSFGNRSER